MNKFLLVLLVVVLVGLLTVMCVHLAKYSMKHKEQATSVVIPLPEKPLQLRISGNNSNTAVVQSPLSDPSSTQRYCEKYNLEYLLLPTENASFKTSLMYLFHLLKDSKYEYVVLLQPSVQWHPGSNKPLKRLIQQSGDSDLIVCRDAEHSNQVNTNMLLFKNSEWSRYKCAQLINDLDNVQKLLLDQVYTRYKHKSLEDAKAQLDMGLPYNLQCTCVYHELAFDLYYPVSNVARTVYPWTGIPGYVEVTKLVLPTSTTSAPQKIPRIIYQTMSTTLVNTDRYRLSVQMWQQLNPEYEYQYFDELDCRKFIEQHFDKDVVMAYNTLLPGAFQADLFRYCLLYIQGGCYVDSQTQPFLPLRVVINAETEFCTAVDGKEYALWQGFLCTTPRHPVLKLAIDKTVKNIQKRKYYDSCLQLSGPELLGMCVNKWLGRKPKQSLNSGMPPSITILCHSYRCQPYIYMNSTQFLLTKYYFNKSQLFSPPTSINLMSGKEHYESAHEKKRVFKFPLLPQVARNRTDTKKSFDFDPSCLKVYTSPFPLIRMGRDLDGGYVMSHLPFIQPYDLLLGAGVGGDISFELQFCDTYFSVQCFLFDGTLNQLPEGQRDHPRIHHVQKNIGPEETALETNLHSYFQKHNNIFLKMDIEGAEYPWLYTLSETQLSKLAQIVIEFHNPQSALHQEVFNKLNKTHYLVHIHGNNHEGFTEHHNIMTPLVFECTYLNKKFFHQPPTLNTQPLPGPLDFPNNIDKPDLDLNYKPFVH
jgi:hypothetical protein